MPPRTARVGVLALQGDFGRHAASIEACGVHAVRVTAPQALDGLDALVMPGGESTTMLRLIHVNGLRSPLETFLRERPVLGTCAGLILLGHGGEGLPEPPFGVLDARVERNAYGRQIDSFTESVDCPPAGGLLNGVFIRAPRIRALGKGVEVVARRTAVGAEREIVGIRQGRIVGITFHPELTSDLRFHRWFLADVAKLPLAMPAARDTTEVA